MSGDFFSKVKTPREYIGDSLCECNKSYITSDKLGYIKNITDNHTNIIASSKALDDETGTSIYIDAVRIEPIKRAESLSVIKPGNPGEYHAHIARPDIINREFSWNFPNSEVMFLKHEFRLYSDLRNCMVRAKHISCGAINECVLIADNINIHPFDKKTTNTPITYSDLDCINCTIKVPNDVYNEAYACNKVCQVLEKLGGLFTSRLNFLRLYQYAYLPCDDKQLREVSVVFSKYDLGDGENINWHYKRLLDDGWYFYFS